MIAKRFRITGLVQGVFFRAETLVRAQELGVKGWVKNTDDGAVEIHAEGDEENMRLFTLW